MRCRKLHGCVLFLTHSATKAGKEAAAAVSSIPREFNLDLDALQLGSFTLDLPTLMPTAADDLLPAPQARFEASHGPRSLLVPVI